MQSGNEIWPVYVYYKILLQNIISSKHSMENGA